MMWEAIGGLVLVAGALWFLIWRYGKYRYDLGYQARWDDMADRRAERRAEARAGVLPVQLGRHDPFTDEWNERLPSTGELRVLAETGDLAEIERMNAAFMRVFDLWNWTARKRAGAA